MHNFILNSEKRTIISLKRTFEFKNRTSNYLWNIVFLSLCRMPFPAFKRIDISRRTIWRTSRCFGQEWNVHPPNGGWHKQGRILSPSNQKWVRAAQALWGLRKTSNLVRVVMNKPFIKSDNHHLKVTFRSVVETTTIVKCHSVVTYGLVRIWRRGICNNKYNMSQLASFETL